MTPTLAKMTDEFIAVVRYELSQPNKQIKNDRLLISRERLTKMLNRTPYKTATDKLNAWRDFGWLDADGDHFTRVIRTGDGRSRLCLLNLTAYNRLLKIEENDLSQTNGVTAGKSR